MKKVKLQIGQVWKYAGDSCEEYTVHRIVHQGDGSHSAYVKDKKGRNELFAEADRDCYHSFSDDWVLVSDVKSQSRECKCGIFRGDCTYHKDQ